MRDVKMNGHMAEAPHGKRARCAEMWLMSDFVYDLRKYTPNHKLKKRNVTNDQFLSITSLNTHPIPRGKKEFVGRNR